MIANKADTNEDLKEALSALETSFATPVVSGELADWLDTVRKSWSEALTHVDRTLRQHPALYDQIAKEDPELLPRVEQLQAEDEAIGTDCEQLSRNITRTAEHAPKLEPDEDKAQQHLKKLIEEGQSFVARVRKQEVAIQTWFVEAFNRDRGTGD